MKRLLLTALALTITLPATTAEATPLHGPSVQQALKLADQAFPTSPCAGKHHIVYNTRLPSFEGAAIIGNLDGKCAIEIHPLLDTAPDERCETIVHEAAHLTGYDHVPGEGHLMSRDPHYAPCALTLRQKVLNDADDRLPKGHRWRLTCGPTAAKMACRATSPTARFARRYVYRLRADGIDSVTLVPLNAKSPRSRSGRRGLKATFF